nr:MAG TPA: hypothetical protein [Caudoviricetes sp.]
MPETVCLVRKTVRPSAEIHCKTSKLIRQWQIL